MALVSVAVITVLQIVSRSRELSRRLVCGAKMKGIAARMTMYKSELESFPADPYRVLLDGGDITAEQRICPPSVPAGVE